MDNAFYQLMVIAVAVLGVFRGYRRGLINQISGVLGFAFGTVCCHVFADQGEEVARALFPSFSGRLGADFIYSLLGSGVVYVAVFIAFSILTRILRSAMQIFAGGMLNSLAGGAFCLVKYMLFLSILFNIIICFSPRSELMHSAMSDDGNAVEVVMGIAPALLGCLSYEDLAHIVQLEDAKKISGNIREPENVILKKETDASERACGGSLRAVRRRCAIYEAKC